MVAAWPWGAYLGEEGMKRGIRVKISSYTRHHVNITMTQAKAVSNYTNSILANMEATDDGYDEAMLLDAIGFCQRRRGRKHLRDQGRRGLHPRPVGRRAQRHHPQHRAAHLQGPGPGAGAEAHHPRRGLHLPTKPSSPAPPPKSRRSANSTASRSAPARAARSPKKSRARSLTSSTAAIPSTPTGWPRSDHASTSFS